MSIRFSRRKKPLRRKISAWLGMHRASKNYYLIYFLALIVLILLFPLIMKTINGIKKYYGTGYGYVPRDTERSEKLRKEGKSIPFQPNERWQQKEEPGVNDKKESILDPYH